MATRWKTERVAPRSRVEAKSEGVTPEHTEQKAKAKVWSQVDGPVHPRPGTLQNPRKKAKGEGAAPSTDW
jgi:hypothetical protein